MDTCEAITIAGMILEEYPFAPTPAVLTPQNVDMQPSLTRTTHVLSGIDPSRIVVSHPHWLSRGACASVRLALTDRVGDAVSGVTPVDVASDVVGAGWSIRGAMAVEGNILTVVLQLAQWPLTVPQSQSCSVVWETRSRTCG